MRLGNEASSDRLILQQQRSNTMKTLSLTSHASLLAALILVGCAHTGARNPNARPVLYPNATLNQIGEAKGAEEIGACMAAAEHAGLTPDEKDNAVGHGAAKGAAVGGTIAGVGSLVRGHGVEGVVSSGAKGAMVGGAAGAVAGSFQEKPNMTFRNFVTRCLSEKGLEVIGWQ
jgi:outer membrane lipoprotein SlyB